MSDVKIAELKARLSEYIRRVRRGEVLTVHVRDTPVARIVPYEAPGGLKVRGPVGDGRLQDVELPPPLPLDLDIVELLAEERQRER